MLSIFIMLQKSLVLIGSLTLNNINFWRL